MSSALGKNLSSSPRLVGAYDRDMVEHLLHQATLYGLDADANGVALSDLLDILITLARDGLCDQGQQEYILLKPFEPLALKMHAEERTLLASLDIEKYVRSHFL